MLILHKSVYTKSGDSYCDVTDYIDNGEHHSPGINVLIQRSHNIGPWQRLSGQEMDD
jgi:hypothetical protein